MPKGSESAKGRRAISTDLDKRPIRWGYMIPMAGVRYYLLLHEDGGETAGKQAPKRAESRSSAEAAPKGDEGDSDLRD